MSIIFYVCFSFLTSIFELTYSAENYVYNKASSEYKYHLRVYSKNNSMGISETNKLLSDSIYEVKNQYYRTTSYLGSTLCSYFSVYNFDYNIEETYNESIHFATLKKDEISRFLVDNLKIDIEKPLNIKLFNQENSVKIVSVIDSYDYNSRFVFISSELFSSEKFTSIINEGFLKNNIKKDEFLSYNQNIVSFYFKDELINLQVDNFVSGVELIETLLISLSLFIFILLAISIIDSMNERKRTCSLFKSFGMENKQYTFSLFIEMGVFVFSSILVFLVLTPFISQTLFND